MNGKKPSEWQFYFPRLLEAVLKLKKKIFPNLDFGDNPIDPFWDAHGQAFKKISILIINNIYY